MLPTDQERRRKQLVELLLDLSKSQTELSTSEKRENYFKKLEDIYYNFGEENFRHYYSDIFSILSTIKENPEFGSLDILAQNMKTIKDDYTPQNYNERGERIDIGKEILKLYDHTNLDISRINYTTRYTSKMNGNTISELTKTKLLVNKLEDELQSAKNQLNDISNQNIQKITAITDEVRNSQKDMQKDYVTILGIFASIILAFTGQFAFSGSVLENIGSSTAYRLVLVALLIGLVFFNLIWVLIDFIREICGQESSNNRGQGSNNNKEKNPKWIWFALVNGILVIGIIMTCISYKFDWFKKLEPDGTHTQSVSVQLENANQYFSHFIHE